MIPYDDLVAALASWRARQGLPTGQLPGSASGATAAPKPAPQAAAPARPTTAAGPAPAPAPAAAPARAPSRSAPRAAVVPQDVEVNEEALLDESFEGDFAMAFNATEAAESTAIGGPPPRAPSGSGDVGEAPSRRPPPRRGGR